MGGSRTRPADRGVSPVIGVILMIAITVVLAAVIATFVTGLDDDMNERPSLGFNDRYVPSGNGNGGTPYVEFTHRAGEALDASNLFIVDGEGNRVSWNAITGATKVTSGDSVRVDGQGTDGALQAICDTGDTYKIIHKTSADKSFTVHSWSVDSPPPNPASSC